MRHLHSQTTSSETPSIISLTISLVASSVIPMETSLEISLKILAMTLQTCSAISLEITQEISWRKL